MAYTRKPHPVVLSPVVLFASLLLPLPGLCQSEQVASILTTKCVQCHGSSAMGGLDLRTQESFAKGGKSGPVVFPATAVNGKAVVGKAEDTLLYRRLTGQLKPRMPMGGELSETEIAAFKSWIEAGAPWSDKKPYWFFQPVTASGRGTVDSFILAKLSAKGIRPNPPADKITLLRRATLDLTGLAPTPDEAQAFLADASPDAFTKVVDRLLASPRYGERWGREWLDLARYADTDGFKADDIRPNIWRYRDYVIDAFNRDKPYDRFIREQIAGDELYPERRERKGRRRLSPPLHGRIQSARRRTAPPGITERHHGYGQLRVHGPDLWLRQMPRPQIRSHPA